MRLGKYELIQRIGKGGMGEVWSAYHPHLQMPCVVKLLRADLLLDGKYRDMFANEARIAAQLCHSRIVKVYDAGQHGDRLYLVMERIDGIDLRKLGNAYKLRHGRPLPVEVAAFVTGEVLLALRYAHGRTIGEAGGAVSHRDIKPSNILVSSQGEVYLTDFGVARVGDAISAHNSTVFGTPHYMAPEQLQGRPCTQSDLYSLGVVFHELVSGRPLVPREHKLGKILKMMRMKQPIPALGDGISLPRPLERLRRRLLDREPQRRATAEQALGLLESWSEHRSRSSVLRTLYAELVGPPHSGMTGSFHRDELRCLMAPFDSTDERTRAIGEDTARRIIRRDRRPPSRPELATRLHPYGPPVVA